jgi:hypothetical protein
MLTPGHAQGAQLKFRHHAIANSLPTDSRGTGDYGLAALVDLDKDGDLDYVLGGRAPLPQRLYWFEFQRADAWQQHLVGTNYQSDVGIAALDVDRDGWPDLVSSGVWYRNPAKKERLSSEFLRRCRIRRARHPGRRHERGSPS